MAELKVHTKQKRQVVDITNDVMKLLPANDSGVAQVFVLHTTCALSTADLDPGTDLDLLDLLEAITPDIQWRHPHNPQHTPAHLLSTIIGPGVSIPFADRQLLIGMWQRIVLIELDGPRERNLLVTLTAGG